MVLHVEYYGMASWPDKRQIYMWVKMHSILACFRILISIKKWWAISVPSWECISMHFISICEILARFSPWTDILPVALPATAWKHSAVSTESDSFLDVTCVKRWWKRLLSLSLVVVHCVCVKRWLCKTVYCWAAFALDCRSTVTVSDRQPLSSFSAGVLAAGWSLVHLITPFVNHRRLRLSNSVYVPALLFRLKCGRSVRPLTSSLPVLIAT